MDQSLKWGCARGIAGIEFGQFKVRSYQYRYISSTIS